MRRHLLSASILLALCGPAALAADGEPEAAPACGMLAPGLADFSGAPMRYGSLAGQPTGGSGLLDALLCRHRHPGDGGSLLAWLRIERLGLDTARGDATLGRQGRWRLDLDARRFAGRGSDASTVFVNPGSAALRLPADWVPGTTTAGLPGLDASLAPLGLGVDRRHAGAGLMVWLGPQWSVESRVGEQRRSGLRGFAGLIGNTGGNPRVVALPEPVDHRTRDIDLGLRYAGSRLQLRAGVLLSRFENAHPAVSWDNPFAAVPGWAPEAGHPARGQASLMPDNRFAQASLSLGWAVAERTRLNADLALGRHRQDAPFLPYTVNPALADTITAPLPRPSLDGRVDTTLLQLRLAGRPDRHWDWLLSWRFDERDNRTPRDAFAAIGGDSQAQDAGPASSRWRVNLPVGHREQRLRAEAGYRSGAGLQGRLGLEHREIDRSFSARAESRETSARLDLRQRVGDRVQLGARLRQSDRGGGTYLGSRPFLDSHLPAYTDTVPGGFENLPGLRQYHLADRRRRQGRLSLDLDVSPDWRIGASHGLNRDRYRRSEFGLQSAQVRDSLLEAGWAPSGTGHSLHAWVADERLAFDQAGRAFTGGPARLPTAGDPARNWTAAHRDRVETVGLGWRRSLDAGRLRFGADLAQSQVRGEVDVLTGPALASAPLPPTRARLRSLDLDAELNLSPRQGLRVRWRVEDFTGSDWQTDGVGPGQLANVILLGEHSPDYRGQALILSWFYRL